MDFTHFDPGGKAWMVDVSGKEDTRREAIAEGMIRMSRQCFERVKQGSVEKGDVLGTARRNIEKACGGKPDNVLILRADICFIHRIFGPEDAAERIYIHFCNPWTEHPKHAKRRLTHPRQLMQYREFLADGGEIWFKTDDDTLFEESLVYFDLCGFETVWRTGDLHRDMTAVPGTGGRFWDRNYVSEHEQKFTELGIPIKAGIFRKAALAEGFDPTRYRLTPGVKRETLERLGWLEGT